MDHRRRQSLGSVDCWAERMQASDERGHYIHRCSLGHWGLLRGYKLMQITEEAKGTKVLLSKAVKTLLARLRAAPATGRRTGAQHRINKGTRTKESKDDTYPAGIHSVCAQRVAPCGALRGQGMQSAPQTGVTHGAHVGVTF